ncbi:acyl-CoA dehydrogenase [Rhodococcus sp. MS16]|uniref:acyl-CoA dehydrogenase family protein n=1 Tax=Rhodococcus TaxID=1827 RepID=UPI001561F356|nr:MULTISPECIES: acyl-CoA dehydrogenase family protein [Rhodococcus]MCE4267557.1 acyl-CoA dehydrogenase family protein [Rhodococcus globerulus]NRI68707.1 acyl-CoA dehydrogenase [Rhodococcus sp. MS16]
MKRHIYTEDHDAFRDSVRAFVQREVTPNLDSHVADKGFPRDLWLAAGRQGLLGLEVPEKFGGSEAGDYRFNAVLMEELAKVNMALPSCIGIHADIVAPYLVKLTTVEQRERWLPGFVTGEMTTAIGMTEPGSGSDLAALRTTAVPDGEGWILNGAKTFITNGYSADLILVAARTGPGKGARGISLFAVESSMEGFSRGRKLDKVGQEEADTAELFFENVRIPAENLVGEVGQGFVHMMNLLPQERLSVSVINMAHVAQILEETIAYTKERRAFGQSISSFQHNAFLLADLVTKVEVSQHFVDHCVMAHNRQELSVVDAAKVKLWTSEVQNQVLDNCVQLYGGYGYMNEYRVARAWRDARPSRIYAGSNEIMKLIIGREMGL